MINLEEFIKGCFHGIILSVFIYVPLLIYHFNKK